MWDRTVALTLGGFAAATLVACGSDADKPVSTPPNETYATPESTFTSAPFATAEPRAKDWFDLAVGDCLAALPHVDLGEVSVDLVDKQCAAGVADYTGPGGDAFICVLQARDGRQLAQSAHGH